MFEVKGIFRKKPTTVCCRLIWTLPSLAAKGVGESQFQRGDIHCTVYKYFVVSPVELTREEGEGVREEPNHTTARKPGPL